MNSETLSTAYQFPWAAVITGLTGLIGALGGAFLANLFAEKRWKNQVVHDAEKEHRKLMREKGEETFRCLKKWEKELFFFNASRIGYIQGVISEEKLNKATDEKVSPDTHVTLDVLVSIYFNDLRADLSQIHSQTSKLQVLFHRYSQGIPNMNGAEHMKKEAAVYERQLEHFQRKLRLAIKDYV
ncbi:MULTISPECIES: hypothetical protein [Enterobacter cloacae complex]|uniref:hypothetical protein n=1 Tax=Enterobacter cloacae complex TaxID=354276 RepID=UPI000796C823|nr:hypothetical protein [Enterobacter ludwigii]MBX8879186.1 hypothetical protein [Enterobacter ludwigii]SAB64653.1 Uncharacterised protein [Enterobacter ludwigii]HDR2561468.1 hypothetical protein [Enterobacter ludwigii]HDR2580730.1 hypothetical protein [Enterobacter ludwigii]